VRRRLGRRERLTSGPLVELLESLRRRAGLRTRVKLSVSDRLPGPVTLGFLSKEIALPRRALLDLTTSQSEGMLAHELAHARRDDPVWFQLYFLIERLFFLQPLNRSARRRLLEAAELRCDDQALRWGGSRLGLASCLTEVAGWHLAQRARPLPLAGMAATKSSLEERVTRLLDDRRTPVPERRARLAAPLAAAILATVALVAPGAAAARAASPSRPPSTATPPLTPPAAAPASGLSGARRAMKNEVDAVALELESLRAELPELEAELLNEMEQRLATLRAKSERLDVLFARIAALDLDLPLPEETSP